MTWRERQTKIVATVGPATASPEALLGLINSGADVLRLNCSHGTQEEKAAQIEIIRRVASKTGRHVAVLLDLQGPKIRVGRLQPEGIELIEGERVRIASGGEPDGAIPVTYAQLPDELAAGDVMFLDDGTMQLQVEAVRKGVIEARVVRGGRLLSGKGVNLPGADLKTPAVTEKDESDLRFGLDAGVDFVALSFVRKAEDAEPARRIMREMGKVLPLIAKVEKLEAVGNIDRILRTFDGIMVARGDLGVEMPPEKVPTAQKHLIDRANAMARPVITATQMLESMTNSPQPTRAEASDVANAVVDGSDAVMLSGETAVGRYPIEAVRMMDRIAGEAEKRVVPKLHENGQRRTSALAFCTAAVHLAEEVGAAGLAALTRSGRTAQTLSSLRPSMPIFALCEDDAMARSLALCRGVFPLVTGPAPAHEEAWQTMTREISAAGLVPSGQRVVLLGASRASRRGRTDFIRLAGV